MEIPLKVDLVHIDLRHFGRQEKNGNIVDNTAFNEDMDSLAQPKKMQRMAVPMELTLKRHRQPEEVSLFSQRYIRT